MSDSYEKLLRSQNWRRGGQGGGPRRPPPSLPGLPLKSETLAPHTHQALQSSVRPAPDCQSAACATPGSHCPSLHIGAGGRRPEKGCRPRAAGAGLTGAGGRGEPREGRGTPVAGAAHCKVIQHRPFPALREKAARGDRLSPPQHRLPQVG